MGPVLSTADRVTQQIVLCSSATKGTNGRKPFPSNPSVSLWGNFLHSTCFSNLKGQFFKSTRVKIFLWMKLLGKMKANPNWLGLATNLLKPSVGFKKRSHLCCVDELTALESLLSISITTGSGQPSGLFKKIEPGCWQQRWPLHPMFLPPLGLQDCEKQWVPRGPAERARTDQNIAITTVGQTITSSNPTRRSGGVQGSNVAIASPVAAFRWGCKLRKINPKYSLGEFSTSFRNGMILIKVTHKSIFKTLGKQYLA